MFSLILPLSLPLIAYEIFGVKLMTVKIYHLNQVKLNFVRGRNVANSAGIPPKRQISRCEIFCSRRKRRTCELDNFH